MSTADISAIPEPQQPPSEDMLADELDLTIDRMVAGTSGDVVRIASTTTSAAVATPRGTWAVSIPPGEYVVQVGDAEPVDLVLDAGEQISLDDWLAGADRD